MAERTGIPRLFGGGGQASVELLAGLPALLLAGLIGFQLLAVGYALTLADGAAEAGALARVAGTDPEEAVREALPGWARDRVSVSAKDGSVAVELRPPSPLPGLAEHLGVSSRAWVREPRP
jgi:hypothetical protein